MKFSLVLSLLLSLMMSEKVLSIENSCAAALLERVQNLAHLAHEGCGGIEEAKSRILTEFNDLTPEELDEAVEHEIAQFRRGVGGSPEGPTPAEIEKVKAALLFARLNGLKIDAALMRAIKEAKGDLVEGFVTMILFGNNICTEDGYRRFCKKIDLGAGWNGENYLIEAGKTSLRAAKALIRADATGPLDQLVLTKFGAQASVVAIEQGARASFQELIPLENEAAAVSLIELGLPFTVEDLKLAIEQDKNEIFEAALKKNPTLGYEYDSEQTFPLYRAAMFNRVQMAIALIANYHVNVDQRMNNEEKETAVIVASEKGNIQVLRVLLDAGADPNLATTSKATALMQAAPDRKIVGLLLDKGADPNLGYDDGWKPIHQTILKSLFAGENVLHITELILAGADLNAVSSRTVTYEMAKVRGDAESGDVGPDVSPLILVDEFLTKFGNFKSPFVTNAGSIKNILISNGAK